MVQVFSLITSVSSCWIILSSHPTVIPIPSTPRTHCYVAKTFPGVLNLLIELFLQLHPPSLKDAILLLLLQIDLMRSQINTPAITWNRELSLTSSSVVPLFWTTHFFTLWNTFYCLRFIPAYWSSGFLSVLRPTIHSSLLLLVFSSFIPAHPKG